MNVYAAWPERLYIIDSAGLIAYKGGIGPVFFFPRKVGLWLDRFRASHRS